MLTCACVAAVSGRLDHHSTGHRDHPGHHDRSAADAHVTSMQQPRAQPHSPSNHASTDDAETAGSRVSLWPSNSSIALLLRGQAFRDRNAVSHAHHESRRGTRPPHSGSCEAHTTQRQLSQGQSLVHNVIRPLEERGNRVDLFVTETSGSCALVPQLLRVFGTHRIVASDTASVVRSQFQSIRRCVDQFKAHRVGTEAYALVLITRHDLSWRRAITRTAADPAKFNFLSRCEVKAVDDCVNDAFVSLPGRGDFFGTLDSVIGSAHCFNPNASSQQPDSTGHFCGNYLRQTHGRECIAFLTDWRPMRRVTDPGNPVANL